LGLELILSAYAVVDRLGIVENTTLKNNGPNSIFNKSSAVAEKSDRLATIDMGRKVGTALPLSVGELGPHLTPCRLG